MCAPLSDCWPPCTTPLMCTAVWLDVLATSPKFAEQPVSPSTKATPSTLATDEKEKGWFGIVLLQRNGDRIRKNMHRTWPGFHRAAKDVYQGCCCRPA